MKTSLFDKYDKIDYKPSGTMFPIDWEWVRKENRCPLCTNKLYSSLKYPDSVLCRSKKHKFFKIKKI